MAGDPPRGVRNSHLLFRVGSGFLPALKRTTAETTSRSLWLVFYIYYFVSSDDRMDSSPCVTAVSHLAGTKMAWP